MEQDVFALIQLAKKGDLPVGIWGAGRVGRNYGYQLIKDLGIKIEFYSDSNADLYGKEIVDGIPCIPGEQIPINSILFVMVSGHYLYEVKCRLRNMGFEKLISYMDLCVLNAKNCFAFQKRKQIAIYTCIAGEYDRPKEPDRINDACDYYVITDSLQEHEKSESAYTYLDVNQFLTSDLADNTRKNRYCKINAHKIFPQYRYSVYFDGNIKINKEITKYIDSLPPSRITVLCRTGYDSVYAEALRCIIHGRDFKEVIEKQVERYWLEGMPDDFGLVGPGIMIREHNHPTCRKIMEEWWKEVENYSKRDMISLPYVLWKNGFTIDDVNTLTNQRDCLDGDAWVLERNHQKERM